MKKLLAVGTIIGSLMLNPLTSTAIQNSQPQDNDITIMVGESHTRFRKDNDFLRKLLPELKSRGFKYLAIETEAGHNITLHENLKKYIDGEDIPWEEVDPHWNTRELFKKSEQIMEELGQGKIKKEDIGKWWKRKERRRFPGWYDLIEAAREHGITVVAYEPQLNEYNCANKRELKAYNNIKEKILDKDPNARVIIYCGASHTREEKKHYPTLKAFEETYDLDTKEGKIYETLSYHLEKHTNGKNLTVDISRNPSDDAVNLAINLEETEYENAKKQFLEKLDDMIE